MRIFICADMEGITGIVHRDQLLPGQHAWPAGRQLMTGDLNAAIRGAKREAPDATFVIGDGHAVMRNIVLEDIADAAEVVIGPADPVQKPLCQSTGLDDGFDLGFLVGHHSKAGTPGGLLSHTWMGAVVTNFELDGRVVGEISINAAIMASFGVPVGLVTGASELRDELRADLAPGPVFAETKRTLGFNAAVCPTPNVTAQRIEDAAAEAVRRFRAGALPLYETASPCRIVVETHRREMATKALRAPAAQRVDDRRFAVEGADAAEAAMHAWEALCRAVDEAPEWLR